MPAKCPMARSTGGSGNHFVEFGLLTAHGQSMVWNQARISRCCHTAAARDRRVGLRLFTPMWPCASTRTFRVS